MKDTEDCQYMCSEIYLGVCKYFLHDIKMQICYILHSTDIDTCNRISGGITTNIENCVETFEDDNESISCLVSLISMEVFDDTLHYRFNTNRMYCQLSYVSRTLENTTANTRETY